MKENTLILLALKSEAEALRIKEKLILRSNEVVSVKTKKEIIKSLTTHIVDLLITDMQLEDTDAIEICKEVRQTKNIPQLFIIVLSDRPEDYVQTLALDAGADDFILKPFKIEILIARIKALINRKIILQTELSSTPNRLVVDMERHLVCIGSKEVELPR
ncbi:MAG TPA: response regulator, partial [Bacteroidia bacterium]